MLPDEIQLEITSFILDYSTYKQIRLVSKALYEYCEKNTPTKETIHQNAIIQKTPIGQNHGISVEAIHCKKCLTCLTMDEQGCNEYDILFKIYHKNKIIKNIMIFDSKKNICRLDTADRKFEIISRMLDQLATFRYDDIENILNTSMKYLIVNVWYPRTF